MDRFSELRFQVSSSSETNDHEVTIFIDDEDIIEKYCGTMMGMDPDDVLAFEFLAPRKEPFDATIVRCGCGVVGCGNASVRISQNNQEVIWDNWDGAWKNYNPGTIRFQTDRYFHSLAGAIENHSWETPDRTAARLLKGQIDADFLERFGLKYEWASGRVFPDQFAIAMRGPSGYHQILLRIPWSNESPEEIAEIASNLLGTNPEKWPRATWYGTATTPPFKGPRWIQPS